VCLEDCDVSGYLSCSKRFFTINFPGDCQVHRGLIAKHRLRVSNVRGQQVRTSKAYFQGLIAVRYSAPSRGKLAMRATSEDRQVRDTSASALVTCAQFAVRYHSLSSTVSRSSPTCQHVSAMASLCRIRDKSLRSQTRMLFCPEVLRIAAAVAF
jgi:hypothetical protein